MKHLRSRWMATALLGPGLAIIVALLLAGTQPQAASKGGNGVVQVGFTGSLQLQGAPNVSVATAYQRVLLNVVSIRLHPSSNLGISEFDPRWVTIAAPAKIGLRSPVQFISTSLNFGGSLTSAELTSAVSVLQLDLDSLQNLPFFFNAAKVSAQSYGQAELILNPSTPGNLVPLCPQSAPAGEGCIPYGVTLSGTTTKLRAQFLDSSGNATKYDVQPNAVQPLVINITETVGPGPTNTPSKTTVTISPAITPCGVASPCANGTLPNGTPFNPALGIVTGVVAGAFDLNTTTVTAEFSGTDQIVASTKLLTSPSACPDGSPCFTLNLPALATPNSTLYDFYVSGSGAYVVKSGLPVSSLGASPGPPVQTNLGTLTVPASTFSPLNGAVLDACPPGTAKPVQAATLQLLVPDTTVAPGATSCDLTGSPPSVSSNCVVVATATTDEQGSFPLPPSNSLPQPFTKVPVTTPEGVDHYNLKISASGFNTTVQEATAGAGGRLTCTGSAKGNGCTFGLEHGFITGTTTLSSPDTSGLALNALVMAEDSGTNTVENLAFSTIPAGKTSGSFTMPVPDSSPSTKAPGSAIPVTNLDVFAAVQDLFGPHPVKSSGHLIGIAASVGAPSTACSTIDVGELSPMDCTGLGSVFGTVSGSDPSTTSIRLSKEGVQIAASEPNSIGFPSSGNNVYNFCAPADTYDVIHDEVMSPQATPITISSATVPLASPVTIPTPCSSICGGTTDTCLLCQATAGPPL